MAVVYVKEPHNLSQRTEIPVSAIESLTVHGFKDEVAKKMNRLPDQLSKWGM